MPALHIRNVDDAVITAIKERASKNHRSLEGELRQILTEAARGQPVTHKQRTELMLRIVSVPQESTVGREEIYGDDGR